MSPKLALLVLGVVLASDVAAAPIVVHGPASKTKSTVKNASVAPSSQKSDATLTVNVNGIFTVQERNRIVEFYKDNRAGVSSARPLPPGIAKNLQRGKPLPRGIAKTRLPKTLETALPMRRDLIRFQVGTSVVIIDRKGLVQDILRDVLL